MHGKRKLALLLAAAVSASMIGSVCVSAGDVSFGDSPQDGGVGEEAIEAYDPSVSDVPETSAPETSVPETSAPETSAPETSAPETSAPETSAPETSAPETSAPQPETFSVQEEPQWTEEPNYYYEESGGYVESQNGGYAEESYEPHHEESRNPHHDEQGEGEEESRGYAGDVSTLGPDVVIDDFSLFVKEDAERDFSLDFEAELPASHYLDLEEVLQKPELPTGCEVTALSMALGYYGFEADKVELAEEALLYNREDDNMAKGYIGDPFSNTGAGCFAPALTATADYYFAENDANYRAYDISGTELEDLCAYIAADTPVLVWTTMYMLRPTFGEQISEYNGHSCRWYNEEHCVVLTGYDLEEGTVQVNDPLDGIVARGMEEFADIYNLTGKNAVVLKEQPEDAQNATKAASAANGQQAAETAESAADGQQAADAAGSASDGQQAADAAGSAADGQQATDASKSAPEADSSESGTLLVGA